MKELVENSLDAGASRIEVDIEDGGVSLIRVRDDGHGMSPGDAGRAVAEHATSKIETADDLARVESLGFRGEALHPIGAVSHLTLTTNAPGAEGPGFRVRVLAGATVEAVRPPIRRAPPWRRELFLNLPVRRGFLGTVRAEAKPVGATAPPAPSLRDRVGASASFTCGFSRKPRVREVLDVHVPASTRKVARGRFGTAAGLG